MSKAIAHQQSLIPSIIEKANQKLLAKSVSVFLGVVLMAALAHVSIVLPFTPVPITGQTFGVLFIAFLMGSQLASITLATYLISGFMGAPVFAQIPGPHTSGYLIGMFFAAIVVGRLADNGWASNFFKSFIASILGTAIIFAFGLIVLSYFVGANNVFVMGLYPFIPGAVIKMTLASGLAYGLYSKVH